LLTTPRVSGVVEGFSYIDEIIYYDILGADKGLRGFLRIIKEIKKRDFDISIDFEHYYNFTAIISRLGGIDNMVGFSVDKQFRRRLFNTKITYDTTQHEVQTFYEIAKKLGAPNSNVNLEEITTSSEDKRIVKQFLEQNNISDNDLVIGVHPSTSQSARVRRWLPKRFAKVIDALQDDFGAKVIITGTSNDKEVINEILRGQSLHGNSPRPSHFQQPTTNNQQPGENPIVCTDFSLKEFAEVLRRCNLFISVDTGPMHMAAAMKTPTIGLFGPNTPKKWGPYGFSGLAIYKDLDCSPCTKQYLGQISNCKTGECMKEITTKDVLEVAKEALN